MGARLAIPWWESEEEGLVCGFCLSRSLSVSWYVHQRLMERTAQRERERITVQAERESETPS